MSAREWLIPSGLKRVAVDSCALGIEPRRANRSPSGGGRGEYGRVAPGPSMGPLADGGPGGMHPGAARGELEPGLRNLSLLEHLPPPPLPRGYSEDGGDDRGLGQRRRRPGGGARGAGLQAQ